jgi:hypothetical protein
MWEEQMEEKGKYLTCGKRGELVVPVAVPDQEGSNDLCNRRRRRRIDDNLRKYLQVKLHSVTVFLYSEVAHQCSYTSTELAHQQVTIGT